MSGATFVLTRHYRNRPEGSVSNCDNFQHTKRSNKKIKVVAKLDYKIPWNKLCVGYIGTYFMRRKGKK